MDDASVARDIAAQIVNEAQFWIAIVGLIGAIIGALLTVIGNFVVHWLQGHRSDALDCARKRILKQMLDHQDWRRLATLSRVIGTEHETTRRLLIELHARES